VLRLRSCTRRGPTTRLTLSSSITGEGFACVFPFVNSRNFQSLSIEFTIKTEHRAPSHRKIEKYSPSALPLLGKLLFFSLVLFMCAPTKSKQATKTALDVHAMTAAAASANTSHVSAIVPTHDSIYLSYLAQLSLQRQRYTRTRRAAMHLPKIVTGNVTSKQMTDPTPPSPSPPQSVAPINPPPPAFADSTGSSRSERSRITTTALTPSVRRRRHGSRGRAALAAFLNAPDVTSV